MSVFEFAMKMEQDGEKFYRDLAQKTQNEGLKQIFTNLADEEVKHYNLFKSMAERNAGDYESGDVLSSSKNIFEGMKDTGSIDISGDAGQVEAYRQALEWEEKAYAFFTEKAKEATDPKEKKFLEMVADEEKRHCRLIDGIIQFVSQPETWVENAEFNHLTEY